MIIENNDYSLLITKQYLDEYVKLEAIKEAVLGMVTLWDVAFDD